MKNHLVQFIYALCALVVITCMSCQEDQIVTENPATQKGSIINKVKVQDIPVLQKFIIAKMGGKLQKSFNTGSYIETSFGFVPMQEIIEVKDADGNLNYTFTLLPKEPKPNTFYNLIVQADPDTKEPSSYVMEYQMEEAFSKDYFFNTKKFDEFKGNIKRYPSDYFIGDLFAKSSTPPCPCEQPTTTNGSGSTGSGDGSQNTGGTPVGGGDTNNEGSSNNNNYGGSRCTIVVTRQPCPTGRWGDCGVTSIEIYCRNIIRDKSYNNKSNNNCIANNDGSCPDSTGRLGVSPIELVTYLELPPPYSLHFLLEANRDLADATATFLYPFRNNSRELEIATETAISTIKTFAGSTITKEQAIAMLEDNDTAERVRATADIFEAATAEKITGEQASHLLEFLQENTSEQAVDFTENMLQSSIEGTAISLKPFVKYPADKAEQYERDYKELTKFLTNELPKIANNDKIINSIHGITDAPIEVIKEALEWGKGPEIVIEQLHGEGDKEQYGAYRGTYIPELRNKLFIDIDLVNDIENLQNSAKFREEISFLIAVTILHEYNHFGDTVFGDNFWGELYLENSVGENEAGAVFEMEIFGETVWRSNVGIIMRNFGNW